MSITVNKFQNAYINTSTSSTYQIAGTYQTDNSLVNKGKSEFQDNVAVDTILSVGKSPEVGYHLDVSGVFRLNGTVFDASFSGAAKLADTQTFTGRNTFGNSVGIGITAATSTYALDVSGITRIMKNLVIGKTYEPRNNDVSIDVAGKCIFGGACQFTSTPSPCLFAILPQAAGTPTTNLQLTPKLYVDNLQAALLGGDNTWGGSNAFSRLTCPDPYTGKIEINNADDYATIINYDDTNTYWLMNKYEATFYNVPVSAYNGLTVQGGINASAAGQTINFGNNTVNYGASICGNTAISKIETKLNSIYGNPEMVCSDASFIYWNMDKNDVSLYNTTFYAHQGIRCEGGGLTVATGQSIDFNNNAPIMSGANIATGTIPDAALSSNIPLLDASNTWSGSQNTFTANIYAQGLLRNNNQYLRYNTVPITSSQSISAPYNSVYSIIATSAITITLPTASAADVGVEFVFRRTSGTSAITSASTNIYPTGSFTLTNSILNAVEYTVRIACLYQASTPTYAWYKL